MRSAAVTPLARGLVLGCVLLAGCSESLFGAHGAGHGGDGGGDGGGDDTPPGSCTGMCIADAAANFDGTLAGMGGHWRYLEDHRTPNWEQMKGDINQMTGFDAGNHITTCAAHPTAPACRALPNALLVSSAGTASNADAAIELSAPADQVIKLSLHVYVPDGDDQTIRLYRNSREDVLFTGTATVGTPLDHEITLDALANDRFLVAVVPPGTKAATDVGLHLTASTTGVTFPSACQLAFRFESVTGGSTSDLSCRRGVFSHFGSTGTLVPLVLGGSPFIELGNAVKIGGGTYLRDLVSTDLINHAQGVTVQFWVRLMAFVGANAAWPFSDLDPAHAGGIGLSILPGASPMLDAQTCTNSTGPTFAHAMTPYPTDGSWQFVRIVHTASELRLCLNGKQMATVNAATTKAPITSPPYLGKDAIVPPAQAYFDGSLDDLRAITGALPCDSP